MALSDFLPQLQKYPGMYVPRLTYLSVCSFIAGYRWGADDETVIGFAQWMSERIATRSELAWPWLVLCEIYPSAELPDPAALTTEQDEHAIAVLFELLNTYYSSTAST